MEPDELYGLPLEQFTQARNALAKELRHEGQREQAAAVSKLRKPSVAAWAVNQLVRTQHADVQTLFESGDRLQKSQAELLAGHGDPQSLRQAVDSERAAVQRLVQTAQGLLSADGHELTAARLEQVSDTLHAAALDDAARAQVRDGRLERELHHVGLGMSAAPPRTRGRNRAPGPRRADRRQAARKAEAEARRGVERARRELQAAQQRRDRIAGQLAEADQAMAAAQAREEAAEAEHRRAQQASDEE